MSDTPLLGISSQHKPPTKPLYSSTQFSPFKNEIIFTQKGDCQGLNHLKPLLLPARFSRKISTTVHETEHVCETNTNTS